MHARFHVARAFASVTLLSVAGCAEVLDIPDDPKLVFQQRDPWRCLGNVPEPPAPETEMATVLVQACNFISTNCATPVTGLTARLCDKLDVSCTNPINDNITDSGGRLSFDVVTGGVLGVGFDGYLQITPPTELCTNEAVFGEAGPLLCSLVGCDTQNPDDRCRVPTFAPSLLFFNPNIRADIVDPIPLPLVPTSALQPVLAAVGQTFDPTTGVLFISSRDCDGKPARGVSLAINQHQDVVSELYVVDGNISGTATQTDSSGLGGFIGVPAGFVEVVGYVGDETGLRIGATGVRVAAFNITYSTLVPSP